MADLRLANRFLVLQELGKGTVRREIFESSESMFNTRIDDDACATSWWSGRSDYFFRILKSLKSWSVKVRCWNMQNMSVTMNLLTYVNETLDKGIDVFLEIEVQRSPFRLRKRFQVCLYLSNTRFGWIARSFGRSWNDSAKRLPNESKKQVKKLLSCVSMIMPLSTIRCPSLNVSQRVIEAEHFRVDRVIGHHQESVQNLQLLDKL